MDGLIRTADKIQALFHAGFSQMEIVKRLGISEQDVRAELGQKSSIVMQVARSADCSCACERRPPVEVMDGLITKAAKIRALFSAGYSRTEIAKHLGIRPQHARNVLVRDGITEVQLVCVCPGERDQAPADSLPELVRTTVGPGGRVVIPAAYRKALEVKEGDYIIMRMDGEELRVVNDAKELQRIREVLASYVPEGVSLVDELLKERRREVAAEETEVARIKARQTKAAEAVATEPK